MLRAMSIKMKNWRLQQIARRELALLDDKLLVDIGTSRTNLEDYVARHSIMGGMICL